MNLRNGKERVLASPPAKRAYKRRKVAPPTVNILTETIVPVVQEAIPVVQEAIVTEPEEEEEYRLVLDEWIEENAVEVLTVATEEVATIKKRKLKMKYEHIEAEFETYTDIDTYLRLENQYHQHITNNNNTKCTFKCTHADQHDNHMKSIYMKCCCKQVSCTLKYISFFI